MSEDSTSNEMRQTSIENASTADETVMDNSGNSATIIKIDSSSDFCVNELLSYVGFDRNKSNMES